MLKLEIKIINDDKDISLNINYPNVDYNYWKTTKEYNNDKDLCTILDNYITSLDCTKLYKNKQIKTTKDGIYIINLSYYFYYIVKINNQILYNRYIDKLIKRHIENINFESNFAINNTNKVIKTKSTRKRKPKNEFVKYNSNNLFTGKEDYVYINHKTNEVIETDNGNMLDKLNKKKSNKIEVPISAMTFSFKKKSKN